MYLRIIASFLIFILIVLPTIIVSFFVVPFLLRTKWDGRTTIFGNRKWGRANAHFAYPTKGFWEEFNWLVLRNPVNNLLTRVMAVWEIEPPEVVGNVAVSDKREGGYYYATMGKVWELHIVKPYNLFGKRLCFRARIGWKLIGADYPGAFVFSVIPFKRYTGI